MKYVTIILALSSAFALGCDLSSKITKPEPDPVLSVPQNRFSLGISDSYFYLRVVNTGGYILQCRAETDVEWLVVPAEAVVTRSKNDSIKVIVDRTGLVAGTYQGKITLFQLPNGPSKTVNVTLRLPEAKLHLPDTHLVMGAGFDTLSFQIVNHGAGVLRWELGTEQSWLKFTPQRGEIRMDTSVVRVHVLRDSLAPGSYHELIEVYTNGGNELVDVAVTEGTRIWRYDFIDEVQLNRAWEIWDEDSSATYGIDKWGITFDSLRNEPVAWCNGNGGLRSRKWGYDGGMRAAMLLRPEERPNVNGADWVTVQFWMMRELQSDSDIVRVSINGVGGYTTEFWTEGSHGWEQLRYSFDNRQHFLQPVNIQFNFNSILPAEGYAGAKLDDIEVWVR